MSKIVTAVCKLVADAVLAGWGATLRLVLVIAAFGSLGAVALRLTGHIG